MPLLNRVITSIVAICGMSTIIGSGFCVWTFVGDNNEIVSNVDANIEVSTLANVGTLRLVGNLEAQKEVKENIPDASSDDDRNVIESEDGKSLNELITMYTSRKIVFTEGNEDSNSLKDGLTFYRFKKDTELGIRTYIRENKVRGGYVFIPKTDYDAIITSGLIFKVGLKVSLPIGDNSISNYLELDSNYNADDNLNPTFSVYNSISNTYENFLDLTNKDIFKFEDVTASVEFNSYVEDFSDCKVFNFELDLQDMFSYKSGKKPNTSAKLKEIKEAIISDSESWKINFNFITTYVD